MFGLPEKMEKLDKDGTPLQILHVGAGAMGTNFIGQVEMAPGMQNAVVVDLEVERAIKALRQSGIEEPRIAVASKKEEMEKALKSGKKVCTSNFNAAVSLENIHVVVEATGKVAAAARIAFDAIKHRKHVVSFGVEMDVVIGHILKMLADSAGVIYTGIYGDEPGIIKLLYDQVRALGFEVVAAGRGDTGNSDLKWNPETVRSLLEERQRKRGFDPKKLHVNPYMFASFNDGSKCNEELTMVANATGLVPDVRGCHNPPISFAEWTAKVPKMFDLKANGGLLSQYGVVESVQIPEGAGPIWCFVVVTSKLDSVIEGLRYHGSGGPGPNWVWWEPIHWISAQAPISVAYAAVLHQPTIAPLADRRVADTAAIAKKDLAVGEQIDEIGGYCAVGRIEKARIAKDQKLLPLGLAKGAVLTREVRKEAPITYDDVKLPEQDNLVLDLRRLQDKLFEVD